MEILAHNRLIAKINPKEVESITKAILNHFSKRMKLKVLGSPRITKVGSTIKTYWQLNNKAFGLLEDLVFGELAIEIEKSSVDYVLKAYVNIELTDPESGDEISIYLDRFAYDVLKDDLVRIR